MSIPLSKKNIQLSLALCFILFIPSIRSIAKYLPRPVLSSIIIGVVLFCFYILFILTVNKNRLIKKIIHSKITTIVIVGMYVISSYVIYPIADALKSVKRGTTADDAIIEPVKMLLQGKPLYSAVLYDGTPISAGPGWILLNLPLTAMPLYWMLIPLYIFLALFFYQRKYQNRAILNILLILLSSCLLFWNLLLTGHDLVAVGFAFTVILMLIYHYGLKETNKKSLVIICLVAVLSGAVGTSRVVFLAFPLLMALFLFRFNKMKAVIYAGISMVTGGLLHLYFYAVSQKYQPFHLFERGQDNVGMPLMIIGGIGIIIIAITVYMKIADSLASWFWWAFVSLFIPLIAVAIGEFAYFNYKFDLWEGANYFMPFIPMMLFYVAIKIYSKE